MYVYMFMAAVAVMDLCRDISHLHHCAGCSNNWLSYNLDTTVSYNFNTSNTMLLIGDLAVCLSADVTSDDGGNVDYIKKKGKEGKPLLITHEYPMSRIIKSSTTSATV